jgi:hypothetical protein
MREVEELSGPDLSWGMEEEEDSWANPCDVTSTSLTRGTCN